MAEKMAHSSDQPPTPQQSNPPVTTAGSSTNTITTATKWIKKKTTKNLASLKSQSKQFIAPDGTQINMDILSSSVAVLTTKSESGHTTFNQNLGTKSAAKDHFFIAFTDLPELDPPGRWILGQILGSSTSRKRAASTKYAENWHNFTLLKILSGPSDDWQALVGTDRCINLKLGANWCIVKLNVPVEELDVTISTPDG